MSTAPARERPDLSALAAMAGALGTAHHLEDVLAIAVEEVRRLCGAASVSVSRWEREHRWLRTLINVGDLGEGEQRLPEHEVYRISDYPHLVALLEAGTASFVAVDDPSSDEAARAILRKVGKRSGMSVPIVVDDVGELYATSPTDGRRLDAADEPMIRLIAEQLALAIARAELLERLTELAYRDPLTGLENRRVLEDRLEAALSASRGADRPVVLILCDLDHLKQINDGQGQNAGDAALRRVAAVLTVHAAARPGALVCRLGGDEFCVLLEDCELEAARALATGALSALAEGPPPLGLSFGIASTRLLVDRSADLLRAADGALYAAKRTGRGQICLADTEPAAAWRAAAAKRRKRRDKGKPTPTTCPCCSARRSAHWTGRCPEAPCATAFRRSRRSSAACSTPRRCRSRSPHPAPPTLRPSSPSIAAPGTARGPSSRSRRATCSTTIRPLPRSSARRRAQSS